MGRHPPPLRDTLKRNRRAHSTLPVAASDFLPGEECRVLPVAPMSAAPVAGLRPEDFNSHIAVKERHVD